MIRFDWDENKNASNRQKHGIDFETATLVFDDPHHIAFVSNTVEGEERWTAVGSVEGIIVLVVVHSWHQHAADEIIRIISARRATSHERKMYEQALS